MLDEQKIQTLDVAFKRIFAFPMTRSTFRQIQNVILSSTNGDRDQSTALLDSLLSGEVKAELKKGASTSLFKEIIDRYKIEMGIAKDVFERGEFINLVTSDIVQHPQGGVLFANRMRRVDGEEFLFMTDLESTIQMLQHFVGRIHELEKMDPSDKIKNHLNTQLEALKAKINELLEG